LSFRNALFSLCVRQVFSRSSRWCSFIAVFAIHGLLFVNGVWKNLNGGGLEVTEKEI
jgi:hypothetical protein